MGAVGGCPQPEHLHEFAGCEISCRKGTPNIGDAESCTRGFEHEFRPVEGETPWHVDIETLSVSLEAPLERRPARQANADALVVEKVARGLRCLVRREIFRRGHNSQV